MAIKKEVKGILLFISYASKDADFFKIKQIAEELTKFKEIDDALYWQEDMRDDIYAYMDENLKKCDIFLLFCSENSLHSEPVKMEWRSALKIKKKIIPIFTEEKFIPPLLSTKLGLQFDRDNLQKTIAEIHRLIVKKLKIKQKKEEDSEIDEDIFISTSPEIQKKYDYFVNLGKSYEKSKQYQEALNSYEKAHKISEKLYDATLTIEIENLIKEAKGLMQHDLKVKEKELEEKANQLTPTL
ncbi:MAG: TIR domain-containing protein, partial [Promethearchaeota archaeon]